MPSADQHQAFIRHFLQHQDDLRAFVASAIRDWARADDIVQDVSVVLWERYEQYDPQYAFGAWARGIAANLVKREYRRVKRGPQRLSEAAIDALCAAFDEAAEERGSGERQAALRACLGELGDKPRHLLSLRYEEDLPHQDIAARVSTSVEAVSKMISRTRAALQRCVLKRLKLEGLG